MTPSTFLTTTLSTIALDGYPAMIASVSLESVPFLVSKTKLPNQTYAQTRRAGLRTPTRGVRTSKDATAWLDDVAAIALTLPSTAAFSHTTAAQLLGLPLPQPDARPLHVTVPAGVHRGSRKAVAWHQRDRLERVALGSDLFVTSARHTWLDLGACLTMPQLVAVTDVMLRRGFLSRDDLAIPPRTCGAPILRQSASLADGRSRSVRESLLRVHLSLRGVPSPLINLDIIEQGIWLGCGDLVWPEYKLVIEYDGIHHDNSKQRHQDAQTRNSYAEHGWECLVITAEHFKHLHDTLELIVRVLCRRGWSQSL